MSDVGEETLNHLYERFRRDTKDLGLHVGVAVDGSIVSEKAIELGAYFVHLHKDNEMKVLHIWSREKTFLPQHLTPNHIQHEYAIKCKDFYKVPHAEFRKAERQPDQSTCEALTQLASEEKVELLVVGSFGRKGEKLDMLGTVSDQSLRTAGMHVAVVKSSSYKVPESAKFLIATDFSQSADYAFLYAVHKLAKPGDSIVVVSIQSELRNGKRTENTAQFNDIRRVMTDKKLNGSTQLINLASREDSIADGILAKADAEQVDFIVLGICGHDERDVGSVTEYVMRHARCTVIAVKNPYKVNKSNVIGSLSLAIETVPRGRRGSLGQNSMPRNFLS